MAVEKSSTKSTASNTLPNEKMEYVIGVNKDETLYENFDVDANADEFSVDDNVNYLLMQRQVIQKLLLEARESPEVNCDVIEVNARERIEQCIVKKIPKYYRVGNRYID